MIETQPEPAAGESSAADSQPTVQNLADIRTIYRKWQERYSPQHSFVVALKQLGEALRDSSLQAARTATEAAYAAIADIDTDDQPDAEREWKAIALYVEGQT